MKIIKLFVLLFILQLISCQQDDWDKSNTVTLASKMKAKSTWISYNELKTQPEVLQKLALIQQKRLANKSTNLLNYGFAIDTTHVLFLEKGNSHSYIFQIYRNDAPDKTENLVLSMTYGSEQYKAFLLTYDFTEQDKLNYQNGLPIANVMHKMSYEELTDNESISARSGGYEQIIFKLSDGSCGVIDHVWEEGGEIWVSFLPIACPREAVSYLTSGGGDPIYNAAGGGIMSAGPSNGDGSGLEIGGGGTIPPVIVEPVILVDHRKELLRLTSNNANGTKTNIKAKIDQLKAALPTSAYEGGAMYNSSQTPRAPDIVTIASTQWINVPKEYYITLHMHQDQYIPLGGSARKPTSPVQSDTDVANLLKLHNYTNNKNATALFVSRLGTFAIRVFDREKANTAYNRLMINSIDIKKFVDNYDDKVTSHLIANPRDENAALQGFISFINTNEINAQSMGLCIYQAIYDALGNIINWIKL